MIKLNIIQNNKNIPFFQPKKFRSIQELFPNYLIANIMMEKLCSDTKWWTIQRDKNNPCVLSVGLSFPLEVKEKTLMIIEVLMNDYSPDLTEFLNQKNTDDLLFIIKNKFQNYENNIIYQGGRPILKEMRYRFGLL